MKRVEEGVECSHIFNFENPIFKSRMQRPKIQNSGWAAFGRKHQGKEGTLPTGTVDPFPSISDLSSSFATKSLMTNKFPPLKSFSSVVHPPLDVPPLGTSCMIGTVNNNPCRKHVDCQATTETNRGSAIKLLKDVHTLADQQLIEGVLSAVDYDVDQASVLLKAMVSPDTKIKEASLANPSSSITMDRCGENNKTVQQGTSLENKISGSAHKALISTKLLSVPAEPEWEEDDVYLSHRKDAIKKIRYAVLYRIYLGLLVNLFFFFVVTC